MKHIRTVLSLSVIVVVLIAVYAYTPSWRVYWNTASGMQKSARCVFGVPIIYGELQETVLSERLSGNNSDGGEWVTVASARPIESFNKGCNIWCYYGVESAIFSTESALMWARINSDNLKRHEEDSRRIALQFIREFERTHDLCGVAHQIREFSNKMRERDFEAYPFRNVELDEIFSRQR